MTWIPLAIPQVGLPHLLDPHSLETFGMTRLGGILKENEAFAAHYRITTEPDGSQRCVLSIPSGPLYPDLSTGAFCKSF